MGNITVEEVENGIVPLPAPHYFWKTAEYLQYLMDEYKLPRSYFVERKKRPPSKRELAEIESYLIYNRWYIKARAYSQKLRPVLLRMQGRFCWYCRKRFPANKLTVEHWIPLSMAGPTKISNCLLACQSCNNAKLEWYDDIKRKRKKPVSIKKKGVRRRQYAMVIFKRDGTRIGVEYNRFSRALLSMFASEGKLKYVPIPRIERVSEKVAHNLSKPPWIKKERKKRWHYVAIPSWIKKRMGKKQKYILI